MSAPPLDPDALRAAIAAAVSAELAQLRAEVTATRTDVRDLRAALVSAGVLPAPPPRRVGQRPPARPDPTVAVDDLSRQRARRALQRAGVALPPRGCEGGGR